jgi:hypothetical protein
MSISVNGARRNAVNWLVDGVMNVDVGSNITLLSDADARVDRAVQDHHVELRGRVAALGRRHHQRRHQVRHEQIRRQRLEFFRSDGRTGNSYFRKQSTDPAVRDNPGAAEVQQLRIHGRRSRWRRTSGSLLLRRTPARVTRAPHRRR